MFRITEHPLSATLVQCLAKNYKNDSIVSVDMDKDTDLVHVNGHDRIILVLFNQTLCKMMDPL